MLGEQFPSDRFRVPRGTTVDAMTDVHKISRRLFVRDTGRAVGFAIIGGGLLAACTDSGEVTVLPTDDSTTTESSDASASTDDPTATTDDGSSDTTEDQDPELAWQRVMLGSVSAYVLARGDEIAIVDTGRSGSAAQIGEVIAMLGADWSDVGHVVLTHMHSDHVGGLPGVLEQAATATAWAGEADIAQIDSPRDIEPLNDGDEVFGLQVIGTPGHTPGHISVLDPTAGFLVAGDALNEEGGMILGPNPDFSSDHEAALASVAVLAERSFQTVVFGHGDPVEGGASDAVVALAQTL